MSWDMIDDDAAKLQETQAKWLDLQFQYEYCAECGGDAKDHIAGSDPFGNLHAYCKPIEVGEGVTFKYGETTVVGIVIRRLGARIQVEDAEGDWITHWITDSDAMRSQPS